MNISHKDLLNNYFSKEKIKFYEKIGNRYYHVYQKYQKKFSINKDYKKKIINWLFSQNIETRMILCSIENKKYTSLINQAYKEYIKQPYVKIYLNDDEDDKKVNLLYLKDAKLNFTDPNYYPKLGQFLNEIMFYQCESPMNEYNKYSNYLTLSNMIKDQTTFINFCNEFSNNNFLENLIEPKIVEQNKINNIYFNFPEWLYKNNLPTKKNYDFYEKKYELYYSLPKFILALFEQVLTIRYIIYNETNNLDEILSSIYLYELFEKRNKIIIYLSPKETKFSFLYFQIDKLIENLFNDKELKEFILNNKEEEGIFCNDIYFDISDTLNNVILEGNQFFNNFFRNNAPKDFIDFFMLIHIHKIFSYDDFYFRGIFEQIYESYSKQTYKDLILHDEKISKKRKKKKKKNVTNSNNHNINNNENNDENVGLIKKNINSSIIDYGKEIEKIISESNISINEDVKGNINSIENLDSVKEGKKNNFLNSDNIKEIKEENKGQIKYKDIENNSNKDNIMEEKEISLIYKYIRDFLYEIIFKQININETININNSRKRNKKNNFFLYDTTKTSKKKKNNNSIQNNKTENINKKYNEIFNNKKIDLNNDNKTYSNNKVDKKKKEESNENQSKNLKITNEEENKNNINEDKNNNSNNKARESVISHINSFSFTPSQNKDNSIKKENIIINNNIININFHNNYINQKNIFIINNNPIIPSLDKLNKSIQEFYDDLEKALIIQRKIKKEIEKYLSSIIKDLFPDSNILIYGSSLYYLDIDSSDLDLSISTKLIISLTDLEKYLIKNNDKNQFYKINAILSATVPIIKLEIDFLKMNNEEINRLYNLLKNTKYYKTFYNDKTKNEGLNDMNKINVDISINSTNDKQLELIKNILEDYPEIKPLIKIIKKILQITEMNNSYKGGMSSYCLFLLLYSYTKIYYNNNKENINFNNDYGSLLIGFLYHYITFVDFNCTIIAPHQKNPFIIKSPLESIPTIIEPISKQNAGKTIFKIFDVINIFYQIYKDIFLLMEENKNSNIIYELIQKYFNEYRNKNLI